MATVDMNRANRILEALEQLRGGAQLLITDPWSIFYLTGFYADMLERFSGIALRRGEQPIIMINELHQLPVFDNAEICYHRDTDDVAAAIADALDPARPLGVEASLRAGVLLPLQARQAAAGCFLSDAAVRAARSRKDARERELMRRSSAANDAVMKQARSLIAPGVTERAVADQLLGLYRAQGCEDFSFPPIVSFGANAADPHHEPDDTRLREGDVVLFDIGGRYQRYCSDMTRTFFWGEPDPEAQRVHEIVCRANEAAEAMIRPGVRFCDIDRAARAVIEQEGYGAFFTHRLGHSIGLQDHEPGDVSAANTDRVEPGMTFSIEPGIYLPGRFGVRIEDLVLVREDGVEVLNSYPHEACRLDV